MKQLWFVFMACCAFLVLGGCEEDEIKDIAAAQECLDNLPGDIDAYQTAASITAAEAWALPISCADKVANHSSQQANIIKCSAYIMGGGLDDAAFVSAVKELDTTGTNKEAAYISALTLNKPDSSTGQTRSQLAKTYCDATGLEGFKLLANLAVMGTSLSVAFGGFPSDPSAISQADINTAISNCTGASAAAQACQATVGASVTTIAQSYCEGKTNDEVCTDINAAIEASGGDNAKIAQEALCRLNGQTFNGTTCV